MKTAALALRFHFLHAWFNFKEKFSDIASGIAGFFLFPFFVWLVSKLWEKFNSYQGHYSLDDIFVYVSISEVIFLTFLPMSTLTRASGDFSLSLTKPRSWLAMSFSGIFGRCLGSRLVFLAIFFLVTPVFGISYQATLTSALRLLLLLPILGIVQALIGLLFACAQVRWNEVSYFVLPVSKTFLALGGVFGPLIDYGEPWRSILLKLPPSDLFFQPAHFCVTGSFYQMSVLEWHGRILVIIVGLSIACVLFNRYSRKYHQSFGG